MERESYLPFFIFLCLVMVLTVFSIPCLAKDSAVSGELKFGVRFYPSTQALVEKSMDISFHGRVDNSQGDFRSDDVDLSMKNDSNAMKIISSGDVVSPSAPIKFHDHLDRIHAYLFQYISINPSFPGLDIKQEYSLGTRKSEQKDSISFEILADPSDLSGGLVFIMPI